ncbi:MAG: hypothetical protein QOK48_2268 [Blastocatellia bacterium]|nr:hypothetical protein [Blastocatellia bacterium]
MSFAVDTNVLLRSIDDGHPAQPVVNDGLLAFRSQGERISIFPQNLIEFWAVATRPTANNGLGWSVERAKSELETLKYLFVLLPDTDAIFSEWERLVVDHRVAGKQFTMLGLLPPCSCMGLVICLLSTTATSNATAKLTSLIRRISFEINQTCATLFCSLALS